MGEGWDRRRAAAIALGGIAGATTRWAATVTFVPSGSMPWTVLAINVLGSVFLGVVLAGEWSHPRARLLLHDGAAIGFCGGLTTFSTFSLEIVNLVQDGHVAIAVTYGVLSISLSIAGVVAGAGAMHRVRAAGLPVEEEL